MENEPKLLDIDKVTFKHVKFFIEKLLERRRVTRFFPRDVTMDEGTEGGAAWNERHVFNVAAPVARARVRPFLKWRRKEWK